MRKTPNSPLRDWSLFGLAVFLFFNLASAADQKITFNKGDRVVLVGGTIASRAQYSGYLEKRIQSAYPDLGLSFRNMGWSADEVDLMPRPLNFGTLEEHLTDKKADVIFLFFGSNEAFQGDAGIEKFISDYHALIERITPQTSRIVLVSPAAHEKLKAPRPDPSKRNLVLEKYTDAIRRLAEEQEMPFIDLFHPTRTLMAENYSDPLTINGVHFTDPGYKIVADIMAAEMNWPAPKSATSENIRTLIIEKNRQFQLRWRPVNGEYVFGRRNKPFGIVTYPPEMEQLDKQIDALDKEIQQAAGAPK